MDELVLSEKFFDITVFSVIYIFLPLSLAFTIEPVAGWVLTAIPGILTVIVELSIIVYTKFLNKDPLQI